MDQRKPCLVQRFVNLHERVRRRLPLGSDDDAHVHDHQLVAGGHVGRAPVRHERARVGRVVHVGDVPVGGELHDLQGFNVLPFKIKVL